MKYTKSMIFALLLTVITPIGALAQGSVQDNCYKTYYKTKDQRCIEALLLATHAHGENEERQQNFDHSNIQAYVGFFATLFMQEPELKEKVLNIKASPYVKSVLVEALYRAGLKQDSKNYAEANALAPLYNLFETNKLSVISEVKPNILPSDNDLLIGAYMASGDATNIRRVLENFNRASDARRADAMRVGYNFSKFGPSLTPPNRESEMKEAICKKYQCKVDVRNFLKTMTLSAGFWAVGTIMEENDDIKMVFKEFFEQDPKLKALLIQENTYLQNYLTALIGLEAVPGNPVLLQLVSDYENFRPINVDVVLGAQQ